MERFQNPKVFTGEEIKALPENKQEYWVELLVAKDSKTLIVGKSKCGKSLFVIQLAMCLVTGSDFLGFQCERCKVLYLSFEGGKDQLFQRVKTMSQKVPGNIENLLVKPFTSEPLLIDTERGYTSLKDLLEQYQPKIVILDPKRMTMEGKENNAEDNRKWCANIDRLINEFHCSFIIVHHCTKREYEDIIDRPSGSNFLSGWAEVIAGIKKEKSKDIRILEVRTRFEEEPEPLKLQFNGLFSLAKEEEIKKTIKLNLAKEKIKAYITLGLSPTQLVRKVAEELDISESYVWRAYSELKSEIPKAEESIGKTNDALAKIEEKRRHIQGKLFNF